MEEQRLCQCCKKNHAARSYEPDKKDPSKREFYCLECYDRLFINMESGERTICPYCGTMVAEVMKSKLVGCAHCYTMMAAGLAPLVQKMQGDRAHSGKTPPLEGEYGSPYSLQDVVGAEYRKKAVAQARFDRQCHELEIIIEKLKAEGNFEDAKGYGEKLTAMKSRSAIEEDFVWRKRQSSLKRP